MRIELKIKALWPNTFFKNYNPEIAKVWKSVVGHLPTQKVLSALEHMASYSAFFPRAREVLKIANDQRHSAPTQAKNSQKEHEDWRIGWETDIAHYKAIPQQAKEEAAREILLKNPFKGRTMAKLPLTHPAWRSMILRALRDGICDTEETDADV